MDHVFQRGRNQKIAVDPGQVGGRHAFMPALPGGAGDRAAIGLVLEQHVDMQPGLRMARAFGIRHRDDLVAVAGQKARNVLAGIAEALDGDAHGLSEPQILRQMAHEIKAAARGRVAAPERSAERDRLAGDRRGLGLPDHLGVFVGHPAHDHGIGIDVGSGNVPVGPDNAGKGLNIGARQPFQLGLRQGARVDLDGALAAAVRQVHHRAFESHPEGQRLDLVGGGAGMEADAALGGAARVVVAPAPGEKGFARSVVRGARAAVLSGNDGFGLQIQELVWPR